MLFYIAVFLCLCILVVHGDSATYYICSAGDSNLLGAYTKSTDDTKVDGSYVFSNANEMSIFRNKGFWYIGDLGPWPPETHYRCVEPEGCQYEGELPPVPGVWSASKRFGKEPAPVISDKPCEASDEL